MREGGGKNGGGEEKREQRELQEKEVEDERKYNWKIYKGREYSMYKIT